MDQTAKAQLSNRLREVYGDDIILYDEREESVVYKILSEFQYEGKYYAALAKEAPGHDDEPDLYLVTENEAGELELETIEDDEEWETVSELYDEMTFPSSEML